MSAQTSSVATEFLRAAKARYVSANAGTLRWMLDRPTLGGAFLNTKQNSITLRDYTGADGWRAPDITYGWIQGRGLEALATHAAFFADVDQDLAERLDAQARLLYAALADLWTRDGHAYFAYDRELRPVRPDGEAVVAQAKPSEIYTYSDIFVVKGLIAAAARFAPGDLPQHIASLSAIVRAIESGRFQMDEKRELSAASLALQADDFGPRMILLGAAGLLRSVGQPYEFADRFVRHVLDRHFDAATGLLRNVPGEDACNVGHGIEFVGFALDYLPIDAPPALIDQLEQILLASFARGFVGPGIALSVSVSGGQTLSPYCPWWSLPETIRSAALAFERSGRPETLQVWQQAHEAFFSRYWHETPPIAYQTLTAEGPIDFVPATPDLDPGYHTGLSLLAAITAAERLGA